MLKGYFRVYTIGHTIIGLHEVNNRKVRPWFFVFTVPRYRGRAAGQVPEALGSSLVESGPASVFLTVFEAAWLMTQSMWDTRHFVDYLKKLTKACEMLAILSTI